jgi:SLA1 Homology Domain 1 (SHD1) protein
MRLHLVVFVALGLLLLVASPVAARKWTDDTGKFSVEAELVEVNGDQVVLKKTGGKEITLPVARLSEIDRRYLKLLAEPGAKFPYRDSMRANLTFPGAAAKPPMWNDANPPFDLAEFFQFPPEEENAAQLYLDAFLDFSPGEMTIFFPEMPEQEKKDWWLAYRKVSQEQWRLYEAWEKDPNSVDSTAVDAWLANYDIGFEKLVEAQQRPKCMFQTGLGVSSLMPHLQVARQVGRVAQWRTRRDLQRGDMKRPLRDLKMQLRLTRDLRVRGVLVAQLVAIAVDGLGCEQVREILNTPGIDVGHCDRLMALLAEHEAKAIDAFSEGNRADYIHSRQTLHDLQYRTGGFDPKTMKETWGLSGNVTSPLVCFKIFTDLGGGSPQQLAKATAHLQGALLPVAWQGGKMLSDEDYAKEVEAMNRYFASILALAEQPDYWRDGKSEIEAAVAPTLQTTLLGFLIPAENAVLEAIRRSKARLRGTQCLVALRRWQLEHAEPPPDLETVVKAAGMPGVPLDTYSDQPLRMGTVEGKTVIYSVGPDGKDDKAQVEWNLALRQPGDYIFQLEKPPQ